MTNNIIKNVLNNLDVALISFDLKGKLAIYNNNLINLWNIKDFNNLDNLHIIEFFEIIRENQVYPQQDNFREYCAKLKQYLVGADFQIKQNLLLANGKNIQEQIIKDDNNLLFIWSDTTEIWDITYALNNHKNMYQRLIDKHPTPILVVGSNGIVENYNGKFLENFNLTIDSLNSKPHIREILPKCDFEDYDSSILLGNILSSRSFYYNSANGYTIYGISMPNTNMFVLFNKINKNNDDDKLDEILLSNSLLSLHQNLIFELNNLIGSPLNSIIGFGEMLKNQYVGNLNIKQIEYLDKILDQAQKINQDFTYKLELLEFNKIENIDLAPCDINLSVAYILHQNRANVSSKAIDIKINFPKNLVEVNTNQALLVKMGVLLLNYLLEQNVFKSQINIEVIQKNNNTEIIFKDSGIAPLFSQDDRQRYDIVLLFTMAKSLNIKIDYSYKNKKNRVVSLLI
jgi:hypothetical protein